MNSNTTPANVASNDELGLVPGRAEFEAWFGAPARGLDRLGDGYRLSSANAAWQAWQAATAVASALLERSPVAIMDTRDALGICAPSEEDFQAIYALQGHRVRLLDLGPNVAGNRTAAGGSG